jgi:hypothetical protein
MQKSKIKSLGTGWKKLSGRQILTGSSVPRIADVLIIAQSIKYLKAPVEFTGYLDAAVRAFLAVPPEKPTVWKIEEYVDFLARIFPHEFDHVQGVVFLDRVDTRELVTVKEYVRLFAGLAEIRG